MLTTKKITRLLRKDLLRQYKAQPRRFHSRRSEAAVWHLQFAYYLFDAFPHFQRREGARADDRPKQYRFKDWSWYLRYMKGKRLGYEIELD